jgi:coproporphyrinogen III oxidase-like Fe-S oxidoreductase
VIAAGESPIDSREELSDEQRQLERLYLGLRTIEGITFSDFPRLSPPSPALVDNGWLLSDGSRLRCTPSGWLRLDSLVSALTGNLTIS